MRKPVVVLLEGEDGTRSALADTLRTHGFTVASAGDRLDCPAVIVLVPNGSPATTCSRLVRWWTELAAADHVSPPQTARGDTRRLVGRSAAMAAVRDFILRVAPTDANVLITGETGTGKELVAELIHLNSGRPGPLVPINCAAIPDGLFESELFGYERGAFTGAVGSYEGKLRQAGGGTVFLDEVGDMSPLSQAKLLRAIESREVYRLGAQRPARFDARIVAATNGELESLVAEGRFRKDLYFRLNVARVHLSPLRTRAEDVPDLLAHALAELRPRVQAGRLGFAPAALQPLNAYSWPGNVRELRNVVEVLAMTASGDEIALAELPPPIRDLGGPAGPPDEMAGQERERLLTALRTTHWNKSRAAQQLHWSRMTLYRKMAKYAIGKSGPGARPLSDN